MNHQAMKFEEFGEEEDFAAMLEESFRQQKSERLTEGKIIDIKGDSVLIDVGEKTEGRLNISEITNEDGTLRYQVGQMIPITISGHRNERPVVSHKNAIKKAKQKAFIEANRNYEENEATVEGRIIKQNKGGFIVENDGIEFFLPNSLAMFKKDEKDLVGKTIKAFIVKIDENDGSIVISRKKYVGEKKKFKKEAVKKLAESEDMLEGIVKKITSYGMFVEVDGVDGLVHYNEISYKGPVNPSTMYNVGDTVQVKVISFDNEKKHLSFSIKATQSDPWEEVKNELDVGDAIRAVVSNIETYGAFMDLGNDIEGFLHISEISWQKNLKHPKEVLEIGQEINVEIIELDYDARRLRVSLKRLMPKPFEQFKRDHKIGDVVSGVITTLTDFGAFVKIGEVEGLLHNEDASWNRNDKCKTLFAAGDKIDVKITKIDQDKEKISLSKRELDESPIQSFAKNHAIGDVVKGVIRDIKDFGVFVQIHEGVDALIKSEDLYPLRADELSKGDQIEAAIVLLESANNKIRLSVRRLNKDKEKDLLHKFNADSGSGFNEAFKDQLSNS